MLSTEVIEFAKHIQQFIDAANGGFDSLDEARAVAIHIENSTIGIINSVLANARQALFDCGTLDEACRITESIDYIESMKGLLKGATDGLKLRIWNAEMEAIREQFTPDAGLDSMPAAPTPDKPNPPTPFQMPLVIRERELDLNLAKIGRGALTLPQRFDIFKSMKRSYREEAVARLQTA